MRSAKCVTAAAFGPASPIKMERFVSQKTRLTPSLPAACARMRRHQRSSRFLCPAPSAPRWSLRALLCDSAAHSLFLPNRASNDTGPGSHGSLVLFLSPPCPDEMDLLCGTGGG